jgi:uncharacterized membrane protein YfcA
MEYIYLFPIAIVVATIASASGFSGGVYFQPFYNLFLQLPLSTSIANGIATETVGMSAGALGYLFKKKVKINLFISLVPYVVVGIISAFLFKHLIVTSVLKKIVGICMLLAAFFKFQSLLNGSSYKNKIPTRHFLYPIISFFAGLFSAVTGTGNAETHGPLLERFEETSAGEARATAIALEAAGNLTITIINLIVSDLDWNILKFTLPGVLIGSQIGVYLGSKFENKWIHIVFALSVAMIGMFYIVK